MSYALSWGGALLPLGLSILLAFTCLVFGPLRGRSILIGLPATTLFVVLAAYRLSDVMPSLIRIEWGWILLVSGLLAPLFMLLMITRAAWDAVASHAFLSIANQDQPSAVLMLVLKSIAVGYVAGVFGTFIGADILHNCALLANVDRVVMGAGGISDALSLKGLYSAQLAAFAALGVLGVPWLVTWLIVQCKERIDDT